LRRRGEAVEYVLCELRSGDIGDGNPGAAALVVSTGLSMYCGPVSPKMSSFGK
jgi:hypothetical protein